MMSGLIPFRSHRNNHPALSNSFFDDAFLRPFFDMGNFLGSNGFRVDVKEEPDAYTLKADLPGVERDHIDLSIDHDVLTIAADMNTETRREEENYLYCERRSGRFQRAFNIEGVRQEDITAHFENGVLSVKLPKLEVTEQPKSRRIDIQ